MIRQSHVNVFRYPRLSTCCVQRIMVLAGVSEAPNKVYTLIELYAQSPIWVFLSACLFCLSVSLSVCLSVCLSFSLSVSLSVFQLISGYVNLHPNQACRIFHRATVSEPWTYHDTRTKRYERCFGSKPRSSWELSVTHRGGSEHNTAFGPI